MVEFDASSSEDIWKKSTFSTSEECVEVAVVGGRVCLRDSLDRDGPVISVSSSAWVDYVAGVRNCEFDPG